MHGRSQAFASSKRRPIALARQILLPVRMRSANLAGNVELPQKHTTGRHMAAQAAQAAQQHPQQQEEDEEQFGPQLISKLEVKRNFTNALCTYSFILP